MKYPRCAAWLGACCAAVLCASCAQPAETGVDEHVTALGSVEVTAELVEIPGEFIDRPMYDYAFIMKYKVLEVHRGAIDGDTIYVGHYNPLKPRAEAADARVPEVGGNVVKFRVGDVHRMALDVPIDDCFMGGIVNRYFDQGAGPIYWAIWTNRATKP
ncbi:MAG: hypothetical protein QG656_752 [Candidatus Hydrogenedentes bacterium]|nr:hypothetical protein [Candidatus Hydrogenedentota bacterium]